MIQWTTCSECSEVLYADANGDYFCVTCDGFNPDGELECWLDDDESSFIRWVDTGGVRD